MKRTSKFCSVLLVVLMAFAALPAGSAFAETPPPAADALPPLVLNVAVAPNPAPANAPVTLTATVDDTTTGASAILSAEYSLNNGPWTAMTAVDGLFDSATEAVTATFPATVSGANQVCVRGSDAAALVSTPVCASFTVQYVFKGFFSPVRMNKENKAKGGQTIPLKWNLTTAAGKPVSDKTSFVAVKSYAVDCVTLTGDPSTATIETFPGKSGLRYQNRGNWMFNWKTPKTYRATCRKMFVEFTGGQLSPEVLYRFK